MKDKVNENLKAGTFATLQGQIDTNDADSPVRGI